MCGITGKIYFNPIRNVELADLKTMTNTLTHRGPDDDGYYIQNNVGLGFRRLSVIDLKNGHQPLSNINKSIWITFNGEIYNYKELKSDLLKKKYKFVTNTDTEVIIYLYEEYGEKCVEYLRGMFAFVIWDNNKNILFGARDRVGIKPFYYYIDNEKFVWGSEIKAIKATSNIETEISIRALDQYLAYGHTLRNNSIFKDIIKLEPGTSFVIDPYKNSDIKIIKYWSLQFEPDYNKNEIDFEEELRYELKESVKMRMISDVPLGAFLSGGVDSSSVVALMSSMTNTQIKTFSIGFKEQSFNELKYADIVSKKYNTEHHELIIEPESINLLPDLVKSYDEPFADSSAIPTYYLAKFARENVTVALSGDGGDELFAGYGRYSKMLQLHNRPMNFSIVNQFVSLIHRQIPDYLELKKWSYYFSVNSHDIGALLGIFKPYERKNLYNNDIINTLDSYQSEIEKIKLLNSFKGDFISKMQLLDFNTYLVDDILTKVDRASMANSLEVRVPILDHKVVELAAKIPVNLKINKLGQKLIFKNAFKDLLPDEIINHKKQGFSVPVSSWFRNDLKEYLSDTLLPSEAKINNYLCKDEISMIIINHNKGKRDYSSKIWSLLFLEEWLKQN